MDAGGIDTCVGTVRIVAIKGIFQPDIAPGVGNFVHVPVYTIDGEWFTRLVGRGYVIDVLAEFMGGIAAGGGAAHPENGSPGRDIADDQLDQRFMMGDVGKGNDVANALGK